MHLFLLECMHRRVFVYAGGVTNWIAIEMLFRRVPYLAGT